MRKQTTMINAVLSAVAFLYVAVSMSQVGGTTSGDEFAVLRKTGGRTARLGQTLKGFVPGKKYSLDVVCFWMGFKSGLKTKKGNR